MWKMGLPSEREEKWAMRHWRRFSLAPFSPPSSCSFQVLKKKKLLQELRLDCNISHWVLLVSHYRDSILNVNENVKDVRWWSTSWVTFTILKILLLLPLLCVYKKKNSKYVYLKDRKLQKY